MHASGRLTGGVVPDCAYPLKIMILSCLRHVQGADAHQFRPSKGLTMQSVF
jgi:hypothetical protein